VLVAADTGDDAAVVRLPDGQALVATLDFFTPIVDDPYDWGRIAATNALSDVYAMGARPFLALNIVAWPVDDLPLEMLGQVLQGGIDVASKAGAAILGGHTITDPEPKYGMVALGLADPERITRNSTVPPEAHLFLTKPLGIGIATTAHKRGVVEPALLAAAVELMTTPNDAARRGDGRGRRRGRDRRDGVRAARPPAADALGLGGRREDRRVLGAGTPRRPRSGDARRGPGRYQAQPRVPAPERAMGQAFDPRAAGARGRADLGRAADRHARSRVVAQELTGRGIGWADVGVTVEGRPGTIAVTGRLARDA
jgi:selenide,water dikinase